MALLRRKKPERGGDEEESRDGAVRRYIRDLYRSDLDRHLWALPVTDDKKKRRRKHEERKRRRRKAARLLASAAGMLGAAGASYWLYRKIRKTSREEEDPEAVQTEDATDDVPYDDTAES